MNGGYGTLGIILGTAVGWGAGGGSSFYSAGAQPLFAVTGVGNAAPTFGSGGGGGVSNGSAAGQAGGAGLHGSVFVYEYA